MAVTMHQAALPPLQRSLGQLIQILHKGQAHADSQGFDAAVLVGSRLYPDMFPLARQVQIATDIARRGVARLAGGEAPAMEDNETTLAELIQRVEHSLDYLATITPDQLEAAETREVTVPIGRGETITMQGWPFLSAFVLPNVYFHVTTAYDILRHNGVPVGKRDFLGEV
ncbi:MULTISPECIES: DUF1993 domain-containing protein [Aphanothece]|uniref:DUF1993 domain-containing protein n=1 Tax=Aphanothece TaxID=1121 RepID=UPI0039846962